MLFNTLLDAGSLGIEISATPFLIMFAVFVLWELWRGSRRGIARQTLHIACTIAAAVIAFVSTQNMCQIFLDEFDQATVNEIILMMQEEGVAAELGMSADTLNGLAPYLADADLLLALPVGAIVMPFVFAVAFIALLIVAKIVYFLLRIILGIKKPKGENKGQQRLFGAIVGAVEGALVCALLLVPVAGTLSLVDDSVDIIREKNDSVYAEVANDDNSSVKPVVSIADSNNAKSKNIYQNFIDDYDASLKPVSDSFLFNTINSVCADAMCKKFATVTIDGATINLRDEVTLAVSLVMEASTLSETDFKNLTANDKQVLNSIVGGVCDSDYMASVFSTLLSTMAYVVDNGELPIDIDAPYDSLVDSVILLFETTDKDNLRGDLTTVLDIYYILNDDGILSAIASGDGDTITDALVTRDENGETTVNKVIATLKGNNRTAALVTTLSKLSVAVLADQLQIEGLSPDLYEDVTEKLDSVLSIDKEEYETEEEYKEALSENIDNALVENGINLDKEIIDEMANIVDQEKEKNPDMTVDDIILTYYDAYLNYLEKGEMPELPGGLEGLLP